MNRTSCGPFVVRVTVKQQKKTKQSFFFLIWHTSLLCSFTSYLCFLHRGKWKTSVFKASSCITPKIHWNVQMNPNFMLNILNPICTLQLENDHWLLCMLALCIFPLRSSCLVLRPSSLSLTVQLMNCPALFCMWQIKSKWPQCQPLWAVVALVVPTVIMRDKLWIIKHVQPKPSGRAEFTASSLWFDLLCSYTEKKVVHTYLINLLFLFLTRSICVQLNNRWTKSNWVVSMSRCRSCWLFHFWQKSVSQTTKWWLQVSSCNKFKIFVITLKCKQTMNFLNYLFFLITNVRKKDFHLKR